MPKQVNAPLLADNHTCQAFAAMLKPTSDNISSSHFS